MCISYHVLVVLVEILTLLDRLFPFLGDGAVDIGLMYYFRYQLRAVFNQRRVRSWDLAARYGIGIASLGEKGKEGEDAVDEEDDDCSVDNEEDEEAATHFGVLKRLSYEYWLICGGLLKTLTREGLERVLYPMLTGELLAHYTGAGGNGDRKECTTRAAKARG